MKMRRILSVLCCIAVVFSALLPVSTWAVEESVQTVSIICQSKTTKAGARCEIEVCITENSGFSYLELTPKYDDALTLVEVTNGSLIPDFTQGKQYVFVADGNMSQTGVLMTLTFEVDPAAAAGEHTVSFIVRGCYNYSEEPVSIEISRGRIIITSHSNGDVNLDGIVNISDVTALLDYLSNAGAVDGNDPSEELSEELSRYDIDQNGLINISDVTTLLDLLSSTADISY